MVAFTQLITVIVIVFGGIAIAQAIDADLVTLACWRRHPHQADHALRQHRSPAARRRDRLDRFTEMMAVQPEIQDAPNALTLKHIEGHIEFQNVTFKYHEDHDGVLNNISLNIRQASSSRWLAHLARAKPPLPRSSHASTKSRPVTSLDRRPDVKISNSARCARTSAWCSKMLFYLFAGSVADNIRYGKLNATQEEIVAAAKHANAHDFIMGPNPDRPTSANAG